MAIDFRRLLRSVMHPHVRRPAGDLSTNARFIFDRQGMR